MQINCGSLSRCSHKECDVTRCCSNIEGWGDEGWLIDQSGFQVSLTFCLGDVLLG
jgi:hypothetical protein